MYASFYSDAVDLSVVQTYFSCLADVFWLTNYYKEISINKT